VHVLDGREPLDVAEAERLQVVDGVQGEQQTEVLGSAVVGQMPVQGEELMNGDSVAGRQPHGSASGTGRCENCE
jgi:hypothetical protein